MNNLISVFDDFYDNPEIVRDYALKREYSVVGNYPGKRDRDNSLLNEYSANNHNLGVKKFFESYFGRTVSGWDGSYNGAFQYVTSDETTWIHKDSSHHFSHAALIFLHPSPPPGDYGTSFFKHKSSDTYMSTGDDLVDDEIMNDGNDNTKWSLVDYIGYKYNRLVIYDSRLWHAANNYFGDTLKNSRLFQCFFFKVENDGLE